MGSRAETVGVAGHGDVLRMLVANPHGQAIQIAAAGSTQVSSVEGEAGVGGQRDPLQRWDRLDGGTGRRLELSEAVSRGKQEALGLQVLVEQHLVLADQVGLASTPEAQDVVPLAHREKTFVEVRRTKQLVQLCLAHAWLDLLEVLKARVAALWAVGLADCGEFGRGAMALLVDLAEGAAGSQQQAGASRDQCAYGDGTESIHIDLLELARPKPGLDGKIHHW